VILTHTKTSFGISQIDHPLS